MGSVGRLMRYFLSQLACESWPALLIANCSKCFYKTMKVVSAISQVAVFHPMDCHYSLVQASGPPALRASRTDYSVAPQVLEWARRT